ncbi:MAG: serine hydrolase [Spirochaetes bacterium]|nr:serine hydrolase [Spirochaetota bacterium]
MKKGFLFLISLLLSAILYPSLTGIEKINNENIHLIQSDILSEVMTKYGYEESPKFKAYIICAESGDNSLISKEYRFDYKGTASDSSYWPASTVKLFASVAALKKAQNLKISPEEKIYFRIKRRTYSDTLKNLIRESIISSDNVSYNFLVQFSGFDYLNRYFLWNENGFKKTMLCKAYGLSMWKRKMRAPVNFTEMIPVYVQRDKKYYVRKKVTYSKIKVNKNKYSQTSLYEVGECMHRFIFQDELSKIESYNIKDEYRNILVQALSEDKVTFNTTVKLFKEEFGKDFEFYNKPGFGNGWYSEVIYFKDPYYGRHWILSLADYSGEDSLNDEISIIAKIIKNNDLFEKDLRYTKNSNQK